MRGSAAGDRLNSLASRGYQMNSDNQDNKSDFEIKDDDMEEVEKQILQTLEQLSTEESTANDDKILKSTDEEPQTSTEASTDKGSSREANESSDKGGMKTRFKNNFKKRPNQAPKQSVTSGDDARTSRSNFKQAFLHKKKQNQPFKQNQPSTSSKKVTKEASIGRKIGIVHALHPQIFLTNEQMSAIQQNILQAILDQPKNGTKPGFRGIARHKGWLGITCLDDPTVDWLRGHVTMWYQRTLKVVEEEAITKPRRKAHAYLPGCAVDPEAKIFMYLQKQNEGLRTENWTVLSRVDDNMLTRLILLVDETSAEELEKRREVNIKFGKGTIRVKSRKGEDDDGSKTEGSSDGKKNQPATSNGDNVTESADDLVEENSASSSSPKSKEGKKPLKKPKQRVKGNSTPEKASKSADEEGDDAQKGE